MSTPTARRTPATGRDSPSTGAKSPSRVARVSTPGGGSGDRIGPGASASPAGGGVARTRSVRSSTLVSARAAAAAQRRESLLSSSTSASGESSSGSSSTGMSNSSITIGSASATAEAEEAARAETMALLDDLKERLAKAEAAGDQMQRQNAVLQARLDEALREQAQLEERVHEYDEQADSLKNEKREMVRQMQQMEAIYEAERSAMTREKEDMANREEEMQRAIQQLKDSLARRNADDEGRPSRQSNNSPSLDSGSFAPPSSLNRSDSRNNSKLLLQKDKLIESLRLELAEAQIKLVESENQGGGRLHEVERQLMEARMANARLMEDNEGYQLLLQEKTLKGDFGAADFGYGLGVLGGGSSGRRSHSRPRSSNQDALNALEGRAGDGATRGGISSSLADELSELTDNETDNGENSLTPASAVANNHLGNPTSTSETQRRLEVEIKSLQGENKALTLYIEKIIERLLEHKDFQYILDKSIDGKQQPPPANTEKELPPPPPPKGPAEAAQQSGADSAPSGGAFQSFLKRTKSIAVGGGSGNAASTPPRARPTTYMPESAHNNPETAPSVPISLGRSTSVRRPVRPMSEQYTGSGGAIGATSAASVVNAMYKSGGGGDGALSPGLRGSQHFFVGGSFTNSGSNSNSARSPGSTATSAGNFPGMRSETSSVSGDSSGGLDVTPPPSSSASSAAANTNRKENQSPPRPVHHEKTAFTGSKPRPLRLVQENNAEANNSANKRASWIGWWGGGKKDEQNAGVGGSSGYTAPPPASTGAAFNASGSVIRE